MITVAIHSENKDLLSVMMDALIICDQKIDREWNGRFNPETEGEYANCISSGKDGFRFCYDLGLDNSTIPLARENFGDVLNFVLLCQIWEEL